jgi:hypothetical protein
MHHKTKRIRTACYLYRGHTVERIENATHWNITPPDAQHATDAANTLADAKALIDYLMEQTQ